MDFRVSDGLGHIANNIASVGNSIIDFLSSLLGIIKTVFYGLTSLLSPLYDLFVNLISQGVFLNVNRAFLYLSNYIGGPATVFLSSLLVIALLRIFIAFVFKIFRLNIDYNTLQKQNGNANVEADKRKSAYRP